MVGLLRNMTVTAAILFILPTTAGAVSAWQLTGSANAGFSGYQDSRQADSQYEFSIFVDGQYLDGQGVSGGYIHQDRSASANSSLINHVAYLGFWKTLYVDAVPGKITLLLDAYSVNGSSSIDRRRGMGATATMPPETDDIDVVNPTITYVNGSRNLDLELSYATSRLKSDSGNLKDVSVRQWSPALALFLNERYDRLRIKHYGIDLTNDSRASGVLHTRATEFKWTHWTRSAGSGLRSVTISLLSGKRLYGVDRDARRVDSFAEILTGSEAIGATWGLTQSSVLYVFSGLEHYEDPGDGGKYTAGYIYTGVRKQW